MLRTTLVFSTLVCLLGIGAARADDDPFAQLQETYDKAFETFMETAEKTGEYDAEHHPAIEFAARYRAYAEKHAGTPQAVPALIWILKNGRSSSTDFPKAMKSVGWAMERLAADHAADPKIADVLPNMQYLGWSVGEDKMMDFYEKVIKTNPEPTAKAVATFNTAYTLYTSESSNLFGLLKSKAKNKKRKQRAGKLFRQLIRDYPKLSVAARAEGFIYEIEHLQIGMKAPDIVGKDVDGKEIRLSQFHGQVVVLDFWGFW